ncbi:hypothetical protein P153DRAFT_31630 [Dothidotthia symphoricarpi CBS 119687]|uniref:Uncharacterized protein n=1 Tax=Dothidotthia symphoricarpi CBS 119687 TaxID=1392245 RepID=A0A6A6ADR9_9PLEO|nr:uncharacterized protein P153DRAFT_31630 [Dothidotthia symphoricarpi CBS 119687]KAF2129088.1 hypothetical protein P153DRAFT_31630 [Dothidotthia symphoricarpi CBS 119687]
MRYPTQHAPAYHVTVQDGLSCSLPRCSLEYHHSTLDYLTLLVTRCYSCMMMTVDHARGRPWIEGGGSRRRCGEWAAWWRGCH